MSKQIEQIRAVIDQRRKAQLDKNGNAKDLFCAVRLWAYADLLGILDTIPEHPVTADLEAEINREIQKLRTAPCYDELRNFALHFHAAGMLAERERLMEEAIDAKICIPIPSTAYIKERNIQELRKYIVDNFKDGDEVRVIIIKKEK